MSDIVPDVWRHESWAGVSVAFHYTSSDAMVWPGESPIFQTYFFFSLSELAVTVQFPLSDPDKILPLITPLLFDSYTRVFRAAHTSVNLHFNRDNYFLVEAFIASFGAEISRLEEYMLTLTQNFVCGLLKAKEHSHLYLLIPRPVGPSYWRNSTYVKH